MKPYEKLAKMYDKIWGNCTALYLKMIEHVMKEYDFKPDSALDIACGTGRLATEIQKLNCQVFGIDLSEDMIDRARENNGEIDFSVADMSDFNLNRKFDLITCAFDAINYLTEEGQISKALKNIHSHLKDGGYFIFDFNTTTLYEEKHFGVIDRDFDDIKFKQILEYDKDTRIGSTVFDFGDGEREEHIQKAYTREEMMGLIEESGFKILKAYKDFKFSPVDNGTYKIIYIVRKCRDE